MASDVVKTSPVVEPESLPADPAGGVRYVMPVKRPQRNLFQLVCLGRPAPTGPGQT